MVEKPMENSPEKEMESVLFQALEEKSIQLEIPLENYEIRVSMVVMRGLKANLLDPVTEPVRI
uniref:Uncharacterized protein n=1 Tax=Arabidopsis thaliana TaxID=3702 RepID=Q570P2_ARATH|nr:hypothetical protein [Arabidopsis thaliana]